MRQEEVLRGLSMKWCLQGALNGLYSSPALAPRPGRQTPKPQAARLGWTLPVYGRWAGCMASLPPMPRLAAAMT